MPSKWIDERDQKFLLHEVLNIREQLLGKGPFQDHDADTVNMVLDAAIKFAENEIAPTYPDEVHGQPVEADFIEEAQGRMGDLVAIQAGRAVRCGLHA